MEIAGSVSSSNSIGGMIVKRVSVPIGLEEVMEGLAKEVLLKKPNDLYRFAYEYFSHLLRLRRENKFEAKPIRTVQSAVRLEKSASKRSVFTRRQTPLPSRQLSVRGTTPDGQKWTQQETNKMKPVNGSSARRPATDGIGITTTSLNGRKASSTRSTPREKLQAKLKSESLNHRKEKDSSTNHYRELQSTGTRTLSKERAQQRRKDNSNRNSRKNNATDKPEEWANVSKKAKNVKLGNDEIDKASQVKAGRELIAPDLSVSNNQILQDDTTHSSEEFSSEINEHVISKTQQETINEVNSMDKKIENVDPALGEETNTNKEIQNAAHKYVSESQNGPDVETSSTNDGEILQPHEIEKGKDAMFADDVANTRDKEPEPALEENNSYVNKETKDHKISDRNEEIKGSGNDEENEQKPSKAVSNLSSQNVVITDDQDETNRRLTATESSNQSPEKEVVHENTRQRGNERNGIDSNINGNKTDWAPEESKEGLSKVLVEEDVKDVLTNNGIDNSHSDKRPKELLRIQPEEQIKLIDASTSENHQIEPNIQSTAINVLKQTNDEKIEDASNTSNEKETKQVPSSDDFIKGDKSITNAIKLNSNTDNNNLKILEGTNLVEKQKRKDHVEEQTAEFSDLNKYCSSNKEDLEVGLTAPREVMKIPQQGIEEGPDENTQKVAHPNNGACNITPKDLQQIQAGGGGSASERLEKRNEKTGDKEGSILKEGKNHFEEETAEISDLNKSCSSDKEDLEVGLTEPREVMKIPQQDIQEGTGENTEKVATLIAQDDPNNEAYNTTSKDLQQGDKRESILKNKTTGSEQRKTGQTDSTYNNEIDFDDKAKHCVSSFIASEQKNVFKIPEDRGVKTAVVATKAHFHGIVDALQEDLLIAKRILSGIGLSNSNEHLSQTCNEHVVEKKTSDDDAEASEKGNSKKYVRSADGFQLKFEDAASIIQKSWKGFLVRKHVKSSSARNASATKIQALWRGHRVRNRVNKQMMRP